MSSTSLRNSSLASSQSRVSLPGRRRPPCRRGGGAGRPSGGSRRRRRRARGCARGRRGRPARTPRPAVDQLTRSGSGRDRRRRLDRQGGQVADHRQQVGRPLGVEQRGAHDDPAGLPPGRRWASAMAATLAEAADIAVNPLSRRPGAVGSQGWRSPQGPPSSPPSRRVRRRRRPARARRRHRPAQLGARHRRTARPPLPHLRRARLRAHDVRRRRTVGRPSTTRSPCSTPTTSRRPSWSAPRWAAGRSIDLTLTHPERVRALVLIGTAVSGAPDVDVRARGAGLEASGTRRRGERDLDALNRLEARDLARRTAFRRGAGQGGAARDLFLEMNRARARGADEPGDTRDDVDAWDAAARSRSRRWCLVGEHDLRLHHRDGCAHLRPRPSPAPGWWTCPASPICPTSRATSGPSPRSRRSSRPS